MTTIKSIEEKARRYDKALERANKLKETCDSNAVVGWMEYIFPELKESGDIRKRIIDALHGDVLEMSEIKDATTWLEKQGNLMKALQISNAKIGELIEKNYYLKEQLEKQGNNMGISEATKKELEDNLNKALEKETPESWNKFLEEQGEQKPVFEMKTPEESLGIDSDTYNKIVDECVYGEQKPDKVEPRFKIGEWITNGDYTWQIVNVSDLDYILQSQNGHIVYDTISHVDEQFHSFTIQDAKAGDVLATKAGGIFVYKELLYDKPFAYCGVDKFGVFKDCNCGDGLDWTPYLSDVTPATKEQRDTLMKAMTNAGYKWDAENRQLRKIEPRQDELTEFEKAVKQVLKEAIECGDTHNLKADADMLLRLVQKPWSEEDERTYKSVLYAFEHNYPLNSEQQKFVKSIKERYTWRPSDEQMKALEAMLTVSPQSPAITSALIELYRQLKKLREE